VWYTYDKGEQTMNAETIIRELLKFYFSEVNFDFTESKPNWDFTCCSRHEQRVIGSQENLDLIKNWVENKKNNSISESIQDDSICLLPCCQRMLTDSRV